MTTGTIDESQRKAARVAGFFYLFTFAIVVAVNFGINERLMVAGDPALPSSYRRRFGCVLLDRRLHCLGPERGTTSVVASGSLGL